MDVKVDQVKRNEKTGVKMMKPCKIDKRVERMKRQARKEEKRLKQLEFKKFKEQYKEEMKAFRE